MGYHQLVGKVVTLKELDKRYFDDYLVMFSQAVRASLHVADQVVERSYLDQSLENHNDGKTFFYCIFDNEDNRLIGAIEIRNKLHARGQLGSWINENYWGGGRYREALQLISDAYFQKTDQSSYTAHVDVANERSYYAHKRAGFIDAGLIDGPWGKQYKLIMRRKN